MGVLLCVMLIGKFPFEGDSVSMMGMADPMKKVRRVHAGGAHACMLVRTGLWGMGVLLCTMRIGKFCVYWTMLSDRD